ncbi:type I-E CRISPR-associated protein Cse1/CasA [Corynebacterium breve]|uniref:Type I-E CRISPR-associated protein Cse1/CasA n=1 Tax=Corynebacterium breve TaxID=3049799 RepID=A0ABY8VHL4_9CORY|nr:type I-E CRISPR-associated protein Cse1/CasA [Corynebacterium breve]WIM67714.1 type I-E CRISPR-associated protein Cse1/CasA [Corynebacterium breve]
MSQEFNLFDEPWITVLDHAGNTEEVSLTNLFQNSRDYRALANESPTVDFAILRIILAILYRAWRKVSSRNRRKAIEHWREKWEQQALFDELVESYIQEVYPRFNLRDDEAPFFQVHDLHTAKNEWKPISLILPDVGEEGDLFTMARDVQSIPPAQAARMLIHTMAWDFSGIKSGAVGDRRVKGGKGYPIGTGWAGWLGATILEGNSLHETVMLNYIGTKPSTMDEEREDLPVWEKPPLNQEPEKSKHVDQPSDPENAATGPVELLTWQQRRMRLRWNESGDANGVLVCNGDPVGYTIAFGVETMTPWRFSEPQTKKFKSVRYLPQQLVPGRAMWRSIGGLLPNQTAPQVKKGIGEGSALAKPAMTVEWISSLSGAKILPRSQTVRLRMVTMEYGAKSSSYSNIIADNLVLSSGLLDENSEEIRGVVRRAVEITELVARMISGYFRNISFAAGNRDLTDGEISDLMTRFYGSIDNQFRQWLTSLASHGDAVDGLEKWQSLLLGVARRLAGELLAAQNPQVWQGATDKDGKVMNAAIADSILNASLYKLLAPKDASKTTNGGNDE